MSVFLYHGFIKSVPASLEEAAAVSYTHLDVYKRQVGTSIRLGAKSVTQLEMMPKPSETRTPANPWPQWPRVLKTDYGQEEAIAVFGHDPRIYQTTVTEFIKDEKGAVKQAKIVSLKPVKDEKTGSCLLYTSRCRSAVSSPG